MSADDPFVTPWHAGLTADVFVVRDGRFLVLTRTMPVRGHEYLPGGVVDRGEDPEVAAAREAREETGLDLGELRLLRVWTYLPPGSAWETIHATYVAAAPAGEVVLSHEHTAHRWVTPDEYVERWCSESLESSFPEHASFLRNVRRNCELVRPLLAASAA